MMYALYNHNNYGFEIYHAQIEHIITDKTHIIITLTPIAETHDTKTHTFKIHKETYAPIYANIIFYKNHKDAIARYTDECNTQINATLDELKTNQSALTWILDRLHPETHTFIATHRTDYNILNILRKQYAF